MRWSRSGAAGRTTRDSPRPPAPRPGWRSISCCPARPRTRRTRGSCSTGCSGPRSTRPRRATARSARRWSRRWSPTCAPPGGGRTSSASGGAARSGPPGRCWPRSRRTRRPARPASSFDRIVLPTATGGTQAGLVVGTAIAGSDAVVTGMTVARLAEELRPSIAATVRDLAAMAGSARSPELLERPIELDDRAFGDGYGRPSPAADDATRLLARCEGILVDPIYTAKALAGLLALVRAGALDGAARPVLARRRRAGPLRAARPGLRRPRPVRRPAPPTRATSRRTARRRGASSARPSGGRRPRRPGPRS